MAEQARLEAEVAKKEKALQDDRNARFRGQAAIFKERKLLDEKKELEE